MDEIVLRLRAIIENKIRYRTMDMGGITPLYVYRMWGGTVTFEEIENSFKEI